MSNKIGAWFLASQEAQADEKVVWSRLANRSQGNRAIGGKLFLTNSRLIFCPHLIDYVVGGKKWNINLNEVKKFDKQPVDNNLFSGGLCIRLRVELKDGSAELFVINKLDESIKLLSSAIAHQ